MSIQLYHRWHCPYSASVRDFIDHHKLGQEIEFLELSESRASETKLTELTSQSQVPCLVVNGRPILESDEIVQWLQANLVDSKGEAHL
jgi:glutaredoxin 3